MKNQSFNFKTGVTVTITDNKIIVDASNNYHSKIDLANLDEVGYSEYIKPKIAPATLCTAPLVIGGIMLFTYNVTNGIDFKFIMGILLIALGIVGFIFIFIDSMLGSKMAMKLITTYFSDKGYFITIGNKSGNNIQFIVYQYELPTIKELISFIENISVKKSESIN